MYVYFTIKENLFPNKYFINFRKIAFAVGRSIKHLTLMNLNYFLDFQIFVGRLVVVRQFVRLPVIFLNSFIKEFFIYLFSFRILWCFVYLTIYLT